MMFNLDKRTFELLNDAGYKITFQEFRKIYELRKQERNDPKEVAKRENRIQQEHKALDAFDLLIKKGI